MKIAVVEPVGGHGGMGYYDFGLCSGLVLVGLDVVLYTCDETPIPDDIPYSVRHTYAGIYGQFPTWLRGLRYVRGTLYALWSSLLERRRTCHFHLFHVGILEAFNITLAKLLRRKVVVTAHDVESFVEDLETPILSRWVYRHADRIVAHNVISKQALIERMGIPDVCIEVIPHGNYLHCLRPLPTSNEARSALGVEGKAKVILFFGQIKEVKGLDLLLQAMPAVLEANPDAVLLIAGKPWKCDFSVFEGMIKKLGLVQHCITHIRFIPDEELPKYYAACDVVALPYRRIYQSGVVLMAMSYGKQVLVSDLPGMTEIVIDGETGLVFQQGNVESLAEKLNAALADKPKGELMAARGYDWVREAHDWCVIGAKTAELYSSLYSEKD